MAVRTVYCVQCYAGAPGALVQGRLWQFGYEEEANAAGAMLQGRVAGWVMFSVQVEPECGLWGDPVMMGVWGLLPDEVARAAA